MKTRHTFHPVQETYLQARAAHEVAFAAYEAEIKALGLVCRRGMTEAEIDTWANAVEDVHAKHGLSALQDTRIAAEKALVLWGTDIAANMAPSLDDTAAFRALPDRARRNPKAWSELVEMCARLDHRTVKKSA